jgi:cytochrome c oxidase assembly protein subunit 11
VARVPDVASEAARRRNSNRSLVLRLWLFAAGFFAFGFALVPLYSVLCDITGYGDRSKLSRQDSAQEAPVAGRTVTVEFLATTPGKGDWEFRPLATQLSVRLGKLSEARFFARNLRQLPTVGQAVPSIAPLAATQYFHKTECFCFTQQSFAAGEGRELIVRFILDPKLSYNTDRVTLSYTMYTVEQPAGS